MSADIYSFFLKLAFLCMFGSSLLVIINAVRSAKELGGTLGQGIKKIAAGTISHTILIITYLLLEKGDKGLLNDDQIRLFFLFIGLFGSVLLVFGYFQIYRIARKMKLFTV